MLSAISRYNNCVRQYAAAGSIAFGIDTPRSRKEQAHWIRRIRREYPFTQFGITWGTSKGTTQGEASHDT